VSGIDERANERKGVQHHGSPCDEHMMVLSYRERII
jgi:hypothetical protein